MAIQTVTGPIDPEALGITLMHEHTLCDLWAAGGHTAYTGILDDEELQAEELVTVPRGRRQYRGGRDDGRGRPQPRGHATAGRSHGPAPHHGCGLGTASGFIRAKSTS